jgi:prolyl 4-hydroxylase
MSEDYRAAMQLLLGDRLSLEDVQRATALLEKASESGDAEASERLALLDVLGSARPPDWGRALDHLAKAASQGSPSAQDQMQLLANPDVDPATPADAKPGFWTNLRDQVALNQRMAAAQKESLSESPRIRLIRNFATPAECRWLVSSAGGRLGPATVFDQETGAQVTDRTRDNSFFIMRIGEMSVLTEVVRHRISSATKLPVPLYEPAQLLHYAVGQRFKPHHDFLDPANPAYHDSLSRFGQRIATFLIYLNDGYEGGETSFPRLGLTYRARQGDALFFANVTHEGVPDPNTLHAGLPPTCGEKWVFSQWIRDRFPGE